MLSFLFPGLLTNYGYMRCLSHVGTEGLVASFAMGPVHSLSARLMGGGAPEGEDATVKTASAISEGDGQHKLTPEQKKVAGPAVHFGFGGTVGAVCRRWLRKSVLK